MKRVLLILCFYLGIASAGAQPWHIYFSSTTGQTFVAGATNTASNPFYAGINNGTNWFQVAMDHYIHSGYINGRLVLHFLPGTYITSGIKLNASSAPDVEFLGEGTSRADTVIQLENNGYHPTWESYVIDTPYINAGGYYPHEHLVIKNLTVDCNWSNQGTKTTSGYTSGFKLGGILAHGKDVLIDNVHVKNFGANGFLPQSGAGTEAFPLKVAADDRGQSPNAPFAFITGCAVTDFTTLHGGYATGILMYTIGASSSRSAPAGVVEYNTVYGVDGIGFGSASSSHITFRNNVAELVSYGFNSDTGPLDNIIIENNQFNYVYGGIVIGAPGYYSTGTFDSYSVSGNTILLKGRDQVTCWALDTTGSTTDYHFSFGIHLQGGTSNITIENNDFYALPSASFEGPTPKQYTPILGDTSGITRNFYCSYSGYEYNDSPSLSNNNYSTASGQPPGQGTSASVSLNSTVSVP